MFYVVEEKHVQINEENIWSSSISVLAVNTEKWRINRYFKKIWIRYKTEHEYDSFEVIDDNHVVFFGPGMLIVDLYITDDIESRFEL